MQFFAGMLVHESKKDAYINKIKITVGIKHFFL